MPEIRANTVLPADRRPVTLHTADGLRLIGELSLPADRPPVATLICLHPLPTQGGFMDSHLIKKAAWRLPALAGVAVLRFNTRGTSSPHGTSEGEFDSGESERYDVDPSIVGGILISPPLRFSAPDDLTRWAQSGKPLVAIVPELDDYLRPPEAKERFGVIPQAEVVDVPRAKHLFVGFTEAVLDEVVRHVAPAAYPLPRTFEEA